MNVQYKCHQGEITEEGTYTLGDTITIWIDIKEASNHWFGLSKTLPDGTVIIMGQ
tara:strand:- start:278 stop:442 length:165 start_codon:yes stop_codon:yes gene_type:complete